MATKEKKGKRPVTANPAPEKKPEVRTVAAFEIPNYAVSLFYHLINVPLHGAQSRARNQVGQMIKLRLEHLEDVRVGMLEEVAKKDKDKKPIKKDDGTGQEVYDVEPKKLDEYRAKFDLFMKEIWIIDLLPSIKPALVAIRPIILDSKKPMETVDGYTYEEICKAFEAI